MTILPSDTLLKSSPAPTALDHPVRAGVSRRPLAAPDALARSPRSAPPHLDVGPWPPLRPQPTRPLPPRPSGMKPQANLARCAARPDHLSPQAATRHSPTFPSARFSRRSATTLRAQLRLSQPVPFLPARPASPAQNLRFHAGIQRVTPGTSSGHPRHNCGTLPGNLRPGGATSCRVTCPFVSAAARETKEQKKAPKMPQKSTFLPLFAHFYTIFVFTGQKSSVGRASVPATSYSYPQGRTRRNNL